ncbi:MAG: RNA polymerase sigma factor [Nannocystaceae bacterium]|nr:RNA polymerase sigma factor [bacterium]
MPAASIASTSDAFRGLYEQHYAYVWSVLRRLGVPERDVEDLLQDVFVIVHRRLGDFEGRSSRSTWLYAIAVRVYWNYARRQLRRIPLATESANAMPILDTSVGPERFAEQKEASALLEQLLGSLDHDKRTAYVLAELEGLSAPEIAAVTGANTRTVYSRIRAAKQLVEASAKRVVARDRNDLDVRRLARRSTARPPVGLRRRAWAALLVRVPALTASSSTIGAALTLKLAVAAVGLAAAAVLVGAQRPRPQPVVASVGVVPAASALPAARPVISRAPTASEDASVQVAAAAVVEVEPPPRAVAMAKPKTPRARPEPDAGLALLQSARKAIKASEASRALKLLDQHRRTHPHSPLARERQRTRILALCTLGRLDEAKAFAVANALPPGC